MEKFKKWVEKKYKKNLEYALKIDLIGLLIEYLFCDKKHKLFYNGTEKIQIYTKEKCYSIEDIYDSLEKLAKEID